MNDFIQFHHRRSTQLQGYDYSKDGMYFITICTYEKQRPFGYIENANMYLNKTGIVANKCWLDIPLHYPNVVLHDFIIMPDHVHGIIELANNDPDRQRNHHKYQKIIPRSVGSIIRGYKIGVTKWFRENQIGIHI